MPKKIRIPFKISSSPDSPLNQLRLSLNKRLRRLQSANKLKLKSRGAALGQYRDALLALRHYVYKTKPPKKLKIHYDVTICGIPAGVHISEYTPAKDWKQHTFPGAGPGDCEAPEDEDAEWIITDSRGYSATWLFKKIDEGDFDAFVMRLIRGGSAETALK